MKNITASNLLEARKMPELNTEKEEKKSSEWIESKDKVLVAILHNILENKKKIK